MTPALVVPHEIGPGTDREVQILLADRWRKRVLIQLRHGALLTDHTAQVPTTIQAVAAIAVVMRWRIGNDDDDGLRLGRNGGEGL